jgi:hypothetical protein
MSETEPQPEEEPIDPTEKLRRFDDARAAMEYMDGDTFGSHDGDSVIPKEQVLELPEPDDEMDRETAPSPFVFRFDVTTERGVTEPPALAPKAWADGRSAPSVEPNYWQAKRNQINEKRAQSPVNRRMVASAEKWADEQMARPTAEMPEAQMQRSAPGEPVLQQGVPFLRPGGPRGIVPQDSSRSAPLPEMPELSRNRSSSSDPVLQQGVPPVRGIDPGPGLMGDNPMANPANATRPEAPEASRTRFSFEPGSQPISQPYTAAQTAEAEQAMDLNVAIDDFGNEMLRFAQNVSWTIRMVNAQLSEITRSLQAEGRDYQ